MWAEILNQIRHHVKYELNSTSQHKTFWHLPRTGFQWVKKASARSIVNTNVCLFRKTYYSSEVCKLSFILTNNWNLWTLDSLLTNLRNTQAPGSTENRRETASLPMFKVPTSPTSTSKAIQLTCISFIYFIYGNYSSIFIYCTDRRVVLLFSSNSWQESQSAYYPKCWITPLNWAV